MSTPATPNGSTPGAPVPPYPYPPQRIVLEQPGGMFGRLGKVLWIVLVISLLVNLSQWTARQDYYSSPSDNIQEKYHSGDKVAKDKLAIIRIEGGILEGDGYVKHQIDRIREDDNVKGAVLRINSPGGTVTASNYLLHHLKQLRKEKQEKLGQPFPLVVSMGSICASGGYYIAMAVEDQKDVIYAEPATWTGSIGVIIPHYDVSGLMEKWNVKDDSIASHKLKQIGSPTKPMSEEERAILQKLVDESFGEFKTIVREGRPALAQDDMKLDECATGQVFTANQAKNYGLVDRIGFIEDAVNRAAELASLDAKQTRIVEYNRPPSLFSSLSGSASTSLGQSSGWSLEQLLDLTAPRAYYLSTWLPAVLTNSRP